MGLALGVLLFIGLLLMLIEPRGRSTDMRRDDEEFRMFGKNEGSE